MSVYLAWKWLIARPRDVSFMLVWPFECARHVCSSKMLIPYSRIIQCVRKVAVHLSYGTQIWLSVRTCRWSVLFLCGISLYPVVKHRLKCNTCKVFANQIKRVLACIDARVDVTSSTFYKCTVTFRKHCIYTLSAMYWIAVTLKLKFTGLSLFMEHIL
jgi:hypothetical protein